MNAPTRPVDAFYDFWHSQIEPNYEFDLAVSGIDRRRAVEDIVAAIHVVNRSSPRQGEFHHRWSITFIQRVYCQLPDPSGCAIDTSRAPCLEGAPTVWWALHDYRVAKPVKVGGKPTRSTVSRALDAPAARLVLRDGDRLVRLHEVETLMASDALIVDASRNVVRAGPTVIRLASRPILFALVRALAEAWPEDVSRETLIGRTFRARHIDESHRARLRVEIGRLRGPIGPLASISATKQGFALEPSEAGAVAVLAPPGEGDHADVLALLADGEAWSSSALALALSVRPRTVQRALETLAEAGKAESFGRGRARRWIAPKVPGFSTILSLPALALGYR